jgi:hypothetical protein
MTPMKPEERAAFLLRPGVSALEIDEYEQLLAEQQMLICCDVEPQMQLEPAKKQRLNELFTLFSQPVVSMTIQLKPEAASFIHYLNSLGLKLTPAATGKRNLANKFRAMSPNGSETIKLKPSLAAIVRVVLEFDLKLVPLTVQADAGDLSRYFHALVGEGTASKVQKRLLALQLVDAAYVKPPAFPA